MSVVLRRLLFLTVAVIMFPLLAAACTTSATATASCAFVVGTGQSGSDTKLHRILYPGQKVTLGTYETISYVPCNSRNYIINNGNVKNANGETVGDRGTLIVATTKNGTSIAIAARALWTLNQSQKSMEDFYNVCFKYQCASKNDIGGDANFSTKGWNGMLAENFGPAMDGAARRAAINVDDNIWRTHDPSQYQALGDSMSEAFGDVVRANLGYPEDLFCGSGNSAWSDKDNPGQGTFTCSPVRIIVDDVQLLPAQADQSSQSTATVNEQRLKNARALYGDGAEYWLGLQDSIEKCRAAGATCVINIGGTAGGPAIVAPQSNPTPAPQATPAKKQG